MKTIGIETTCRINNYNKVLASARLRCYDLINYFKDDPDINVELYNSYKKYDIVVFQKLFTDAAIREAQRVKIVNGSKTVFDIGINYIELDDECVSESQVVNCKRMLKVIDHMSVSSPFLKEVYSQVHKSVHFINDAVEDRFLKYTKKHNKVWKREQSEDFYLVYCGYSNKAHELNLIKDVLTELRERYLISLLYITDKDPGNFIGIPYKFVKFDYEHLPIQLMQGDIKLAPRNLNRVYNKGHSVIKIAYPMSVGLPVVASPTPSYISYLQEGNICCNEDEWYCVLEDLIKSESLRDLQGSENKELVREELCLSATGREWREFFKGI